jgi:hypothetical protein
MFLLLSFHKLFRRIISMSRNKSNQSNKTFSTKKSSRISQQNNFSYQSLFLWINFLWNLISLGVMNQKVEAQSLLATLDLSTLTGNQGLVIQGAVTGHQTGVSVSGAGDVNEDGISDLLVGALYASPSNRSQAGAAYVIYGSRILPAALDLNIALTSTQGMVIWGAVAGDQTGISVSAAGDVNGDGKSDILVGVNRASLLNRTYAGAAYVIYGGQTLPAVLDLNTTLTATQGLAIQGAVANDLMGISVSAAGDVNGDSISDLVVGAYSASPLSRYQAGTAYVIYGSQTLPAVLDLLMLTATQGLVIRGAVAGDHAGFSVSAAGDVNGDGISDVVVSSYLASPQGRTQAGVVYLIYGSASLPAMLDLNTVIVATQGMVIWGAKVGDETGRSVGAAGDVNGDGISDIVVGAFGASPQDRNLAGAVYVIYGNLSLPAVLDLAVITASQGLMIQGAMAGDHIGTSVSTAGDVNGDGISDLVVGADTASPLNRSSAGAAYLIYGSQILPAVLDLNITLTSAQGLVIQGSAKGDQIGVSVSAAGDVNGDGKSGLVVGANGASPLNRSRAGAAYLIYSSVFLAANTTVKIPLLTTAKTSFTTVLTTPSTTISTTTFGSTLTTTTNSMITTSAVTDPSTQLTPAHTVSSNANSTVIEAVAGSVGGFALAACLGAIGFYACRKKSGVNQSRNAAANIDNVGLKDKSTITARPNYGKIDELKKNEKEYDDVPKLEI